MTGELFERPHVADGVIWSEREPGRTFQACAVCGAELVGVPTGAGVKLDTFDDGTEVGSGCPGKKQKRRSHATDHRHDDE